MAAASATAIHRNQVDLSDFINWSGIECLNQNFSHTFTNALSQTCRDNDSLLLESDADEQILMYIPFNQVIKLHSLVIKGPEEEGKYSITPFISSNWFIFLLDISISSGWRFIWESSQASFVMQECFEGGLWFGQWGLCCGGQGWVLDCSYGRDEREVLSLSPCLAGIVQPPARSWLVAREIWLRIARFCSALTY
ncbi:PITH domain-containing protein, partial [Cucurbita argyrosperma subsp. argyrosperma]